MPRVRLEETKDWQLADRSHDVRGRELRDSVGRALGTIQTMIVDTDARRVEAVVLEDGNEYPVRARQIMEQAVYFIPAAGAVETAPADVIGQPASMAPEEVRTPIAESPDVAPFEAASPEIPPPAAMPRDDFAPTAAAFASDTFVPETMEPADPDVAPGPLDVAEPAPAHPSERFTWHPATPDTATPAAPEPGSTWESTPAAGDWAMPSADTTPAPPAMDPVADSPDASSPYAPPTYTPPSYDPPPVPPPYSASTPTDEPALEAQREGYASAVTPASDAFVPPSDVTPAPPGVEPLGDAFAAPAMHYAEPTREGDFIADTTPPEEMPESPYDAQASDVAPGPPDLPEESASYSAFTSAGLAAGGLGAGGFATPPPVPSEEGSATQYPDADVRPVEPLVTGGSEFVAPPEPGHAPAPYAGVAPEPGFPTHAAPPEAAIGHTYETPVTSPPPDLPMADDPYRAHFDEQFAGMGASYDDVADAYRFGEDAARDPELRWADDDALRRRFNARYGYPEEDRMAWLGARRAVRHGLERGRG